MNFDAILQQIPPFGAFASGLKLRTAATLAQPVLSSIFARQRIVGESETVAVREQQRVGASLWNELAVAFHTE